MPHSDTYREAMEKVTASEAWKADTLQKMEAALQEQSNTGPVFHKRKAILWKKAALPLAAAAVVAVVALPLGRSLLPASAGGAAGTSQAATAPDIALDAAPRMVTEDAAAPAPAAAPFALGSGIAEGSAETQASGYGQLVQAGSPEAALPDGTQPLEDTLDEAARQQALAELERQLAQDEENGLLAEPLTGQDVLASGCLEESGTNTALFVLPAGEQGYYLYAVPLA